jgi:putrescine---pyruvate transaminase
MGARLMYGLQSLSDHPLVGDVRGRGMLAALELVVDKEKKTPLPAAADVGRRIFDRAWDSGLIVRAFAHGCIGYAPPLCCTAAEIDTIVERTRRVLDLTLEDADIRAAMRGSHEMPSETAIRHFLPCRAYVSECGLGAGA